MKRGAAIACAALFLAQCREAQSVLTPQGAQAAEITHLAWILFIGGTLILAVVVIATWLAIDGSVRMRRWLATESLVVVGGIAFPALTLAGLLAYGLLLIHGGSGAPGDRTDTLSIEVTGEQWWWRVDYPGPDGKRFASANEIRIPVGREIVFTLKSADVIHSFWVPSLGGKVDMIPGRATALRISAGRSGIYRGQCAEYCGGPHALMALHVVAMPNAEFQTWLAREAAPAEAPPGGEERRGQTLFLSAGCGACHAIRGTSADGVLGPDLTHLGARRSIGADTLTLTLDNIARFIAEGQHVKPGNTMPEFRIFADDERRAVAAYLLSLR